MRRPTHRLASAATRGAATLTVVMILFFIMAMVAAYTNRTLIVDQRASANNMRGAMALEAADAGVEWALMQLNGPRATLACASSDQQADLEFRSRYLTLNPDSTWSVQVYSSGGVNYAYSPSCVANAGSWTCSCPTAAAPAPSLSLPPDGLGQAFRVTFQAIQGAAYPAHAGTIGILSQGCSNLGSGGNDCTSTSQVPQVDAVAQVTASVGLVRALPYPPAAAITAGTTINGTTLRVANTDPSTGVTVHAGGAINVTTAEQYMVPPGSAGDGKVGNDAQLAARAAVGGRFFESLFGMDTNNYRRQPGVKIVGCNAGCTSADLTDPLARYPARVIWIDGNLTLDTAATLGSVAQPVMLVVTGTVTLNAAVTYYGLIYANAVTWSGGAATATVIGAIVAETSFVGNATASVAYDATLLSTISRSYGSFVRVPGGNQYF